MAVIDHPLKSSLSRRAPTPANGPLLTSEEFLDWLEPGIHADLIGGKTFMHSPVNLKHARILNFIDATIRLYLEEIELGGELHREQVAVRLTSRDTFMPDLAYFTPSQVLALPLSHATMAPAFVLEALSPSSVERDTVRKFAAYELHGVLEYWIIDPEHGEHRFFRRSGQVFSEYGQQEASVESQVLGGFFLKRAWLNDPNQLPAIKACLTEVLRKVRRKGGKS